MPEQELVSSSPEYYEFSEEPQFREANVDIAAVIFDGGRGHTVSAAAASHTHVFIGTHDGTLYVLDHSLSTDSKQYVARAHSASVLDISCTRKDDFVASASLDGSVIVLSIDTKSAIQYKHSRPMHAVAIDPDYPGINSARYRVVSGGLAGELMLHERTWRGPKETVLHADEGPIMEIKWNNQLLAWANDQRVCVYNMASSQIIHVLSKPESILRADFFRCRILWTTADRLMIAWKNHMTRIGLRQSSSTDLTLEARVLKSFDLDATVAGMALIDKNMTVLTYRDKDAISRSSSASAPTGKSARLTDSENDGLGPSHTHLGIESSQGSRDEGIATEPSEIDKTGALESLRDHSPLEYVLELRIVSQEEGDISTDQLSIRLVAGARPGDCSLCVIQQEIAGIVGKSQQSNGKKPEFQTIEGRLERWDTDDSDKQFEGEVACGTSQDTKSFDNEEDAKDSAQKNGIVSSIGKEEQRCLSQSQSKLSLKQKARKLQSQILIVTPRTMITAIPRGPCDHMEWLLHREQYLEAIEYFKQHKYQLEIGKYDIRDMHRQYLQQLLKAGDLEGIAAHLRFLDSINEDEWSFWINEFIDKDALALLATPLIVKNPKLNSALYEKVILYFLHKKSDIFGDLLNQWLPALNNLDEIIEQIEKHRENGQASKKLLISLATLYKYSGYAEKAIPLYISASTTAVIPFIQKHKLELSLKPYIYEFLTMSSQSSQSIHLDRHKQPTIAVNKDALEYLIEKKSLITPAVVLQKLKGHSEIQYAYCRELDMYDSASEELNNLQIDLFARYDHGKLFELLKRCSNYNLGNAAEICRERRFIPELVQIYIRMGDLEQALKLLLDDEDDPEAALDLVKRYDMPQLWTAIIDHVLLNTEKIPLLISRVPAAKAATILRKLMFKTEIPGLRTAIIELFDDISIFRAASLKIRDLIGLNAVNVSTSLRQRLKQGYFMSGVRVEKYDDALHQEESPSKRFIESQTTIQSQFVDMYPETSKSAAIDTEGMHRCEREGIVLIRSCSPKCPSEILSVKGAIKPLRQFKSLSDKFFETLVVEEALNNESELQVTTT